MIGQFIREIYLCAVVVVVFENHPLRYLALRFYRGRSAVGWC